MFCPECGKELTEAEVLCPECGASILPADGTQEAEPVQESLEEIQITIPEMDMNEEETAAEETEEAPEETEEAPAEETEVEVTEEPAEEEEQEEEFTTDMDADAIVAEFLSEVAAAEEAKAAEEETADQEEEAPKKKKKSRKVLWAILIPVIIVALLAAAAGGVYFLATQNYEEATACVEAKEYDKALELFEKFSFYGDSQEHIDELNRLQKAYDDAAAQATAHDYVSAIAILSQLGDYRDSQTLVQTTLPYARAGYLMASAEAADASALSQHPDYTNALATPEDPTITLYEGAAKLYMAMGDYEDCLAQASQCYSRIAFIYMEQELFEEALNCMDHLNESDAAAVLAQYMTYCADEAAMTALANSVRVRATLEETLEIQQKEAEEATDAEEETEVAEEETEATEETPVEVEKLTYRDLVEAEQELLAQFEEDLLYYDTQLKDAMAMYRKGLETEASALDEEGNIKDKATWYTGSSMRALAVETLVESIGFLSDNPQLQAAYAGKADLYNACAVLENVIPLHLTEENISHSEESGDYYTFENSTGISFNLTVYHTFLDKDGETVLYHECEPVAIAGDATVELPFLTPAEDEEWEKHTITWVYEVTQNA